MEVKGFTVNTKSGLAFAHSNPPTGQPQLLHSAVCRKITQKSSIVPSQRRRTRCGFQESTRDPRIILNCTSAGVPVTRDQRVGSAIVLVDHGSRAAAANEMLHELVDAVQSRSGSVPIYPAHMELATPTVADAINAAVADGARHVIVVPFFLARGRHVTADIPALVADAVRRHQGVTFDIREPVGTHPAIADVVVDRARLSTI